MVLGPGGLSCYLIVGHSVTWDLELSVSDGVTNLAAWMVHVRSHLIRYALPLRSLVACLTDTLQGSTVGDRATSSRLATFLSFGDPQFPTRHNKRSHWSTLLHSVIRGFRWRSMVLLTSTVDRFGLQVKVIAKFSKAVSRHKEVARLSRPRKIRTRSLRAHHPTCPALLLSCCIRIRFVRR